MLTEEQKDRARERFKKLHPDAQRAIRLFAAMHKGKPASEVFKKEIETTTKIFTPLIKRVKENQHRKGLKL